MNNIQEFEKYWEENGLPNPWKKRWAWDSWQARQPEIDALKAEVELLRKDAERLDPEDCGTVCQASQADGIICPHDSCDIEDGVRTAPTPPVKIPYGFTAETWGALERAIDAGYDGNAMCVLPTPPAQDEPVFSTEDLPLPEDTAIQAAHPLNTSRFDLYGEAQRLVGAKHSKFALVDLVNWLLSRIEPAQGEPVGFTSQSMIDGLKAGKRVQNWILPRIKKDDPDFYNMDVPLYTRPQSDTLRKAAEALIWAYDNHEHCITEIGDLRAALEGK